MDSQYLDCQLEGMTSFLSIHFISANSHSDQWSCLTNKKRIQQTQYGKLNKRIAEFQQCRDVIHLDHSWKMYYLFHMRFKIDRSNSNITRTTCMQIAWSLLRHVILNIKRSNILVPRLKFIICYFKTQWYWAVLPMKGGQWKTVGLHKQNWRV